MKNQSSTVASIGAVGVTLLVTLTVSQLVVIVLAKILGPDDFGFYAVCLVFINLLTYVSTLGLDSAVIHRQMDTDRAVETASTLRYSASFLLAILLFALAPVIANIAGSSMLTAPLRVSSIAVVVAALGFDTSLRLTKDLLFKSVSMTRITNIAVWSATALLLAYLGFGFWSLLFAYIAGMIATAITLWFLRPWKISHRIDAHLARELLRYGIFPLAVGFMSYLIWNVDKLAVGAILGSSALLGSYYIAFNYGMMIPTLFTGATSTVMFATFSKMQTDLTGLREKYLKALKYLSHISIPAGVGLAVVSKKFVLVILGSDWSAAIAPLEIFSIVGILSALTTPAASIFLATGNQHKMFRQTFVISVIYFVFLVPSVFYWELVGVAAMILFVMSAAFVWVLLMVAGILRFSLADELKMLIVPTAASAIMAVVAFGLEDFMDATMLGLVVQVVVAIATYTSCVFLMTKGKIVNEVKDLIASARRK